MKLGKSSFQFDSVYLKETATVVGEFEGDGPLAKHFDIIEKDTHFGMDSWEKAEIRMNELAIKKVLQKSGLQQEAIDIAFAGDLVNQLVPTHYAMRNFDMPFLGTYAACATMTESLFLASHFVATASANNALCFSSSHNMMAEKQYRTPVEYGGPKGDTAQFTATASGAAIVSNTPSKVAITGATVGMIIDAQQKDPADMGSAMAPAAYDTLSRHFKAFGVQPSAYDLILTGDLATVGSPILIDLLARDGYDISKQHNDCGKLLYDEAKQPTLAGGSGAGCAPAVVYGHIYDALKTGKYKKVLVCATGALLNPTIVAQKETIPCIAHAVVLEAVGGAS